MSDLHEFVNSEGWRKVYKVVFGIWKEYLVKARGNRDQYEIGVAHGGMEVAERIARLPISGFEGTKDEKDSYLGKIAKTKDKMETEVFEEATGNR
jgi:hypothetical protein